MFLYFFIVAGVAAIADGQTRLRKHCTPKRNMLSKDLLFVVVADNDAGVLLLGPVDVSGLAGQPR